MIAADLAHALQDAARIILAAKMQLAQRASCSGADGCAGCGASVAMGAAMTYWTSRDIGHDTIPQAAHAASELRDDEDAEDFGVVRGLIAAAVITAAALLAALVIAGFVA